MAKSKTTENEKPLVFFRDFLTDDQLNNPKDPITYTMHRNQVTAPDHLDRFKKEAKAAPATEQETETV